MDLAQGVKSRTKKSNDATDVRAEKRKGNKGMQVPRTKQQGRWTEPSRVTGSQPASPGPLNPTNSVNSTRNPQPCPVSPIFQPQPTVDWEISPLMYVRHPVRSARLTLSQTAKRWSGSLGVWGVGAGTALLFVRGPTVRVAPSELFWALAPLRHSKGEKHLPSQGTSGWSHTVLHVVYSRQPSIPFSSSSATTSRIRPPLPTSPSKTMLPLENIVTFY